MAPNEVEQEANKKQQVDSNGEYAVEVEAPVCCSTTAGKPAIL